MKMLHVRKRGNGTDGNVYQECTDNDNEQKWVSLNKQSYQMKLFLYLHDGQEVFVHGRRYKDKRCFLTLFVNEAGER